MNNCIKKPDANAFLRFSLCGLLGALIISVVILASVPPVSRDALTHHLAVPKLYLKHGGIYEIPSIIFSYYPMNLDLLYMIPLYFGNDIIPKFIHFTFALLTAWLIFGYLKRRLNTLYGLFGVLFFLSIPVIVKLSITVYVDLGLIFFSTASLIYLLKWNENHLRLRYLIISAAWCGLALGTKYNALILFFLLTLFVPFIHSRATKRRAHQETPTPANRISSGQAGKPSTPFKAMGYGAIFVLVALLVFSPWMVRNCLWTQNPIYPLYKNWFSKDRLNSKTAGSISGSVKGSTGVLKTKKKPMGPFAIRRFIYNETGWETALIPIRIFFQGRDDDPKYFDGRLNPFLFLLPFFAFYHLRKNAPLLRTEKGIWLAFAILYLLYAFCTTDMRIRYITPIIPSLVVLSTFGLHEICGKVGNRNSVLFRKLGGGGVLGLVSILLFINGSYVVNQFGHVKPLTYMTGRVSREQYIAKYRPEYATIQFANQNLSADAKILAVFLGNRRYYSDRDMLFGINLFKKVIKRADSSDKILSDLKKRRITHLLVRYDLLNQWAHTTFDDRKKRMIGNLFNERLSLVFSKGGHGLYRLEDAT